MTANEPFDGERESIAERDEIIEAGDGAEVLTDGGAAALDLREATYLRNQAESIVDAVNELATAVDRDDLDADTINDVRVAIGDLQEIVEREFAEETPGVEPYEKAVRNVPFGTLADTLGVELSDLNKLLRAQQED